MGKAAVRVWVQQKASISSPGLHLPWIEGANEKKVVVHRKPNNNHLVIQKYNTKI